MVVTPSPYREELYIDQLSLDISIQGEEDGYWDENPRTLNGIYLTHYRKGQEIKESELREFWENLHHEGLC